MLLNDIADISSRVKQRLFDSSKDWDAIAEATLKQQSSTSNTVPERQTETQTVSWLPANMEKLMAQCTEELSIDTITTTVVMVNARQKETLCALRVTGILQTKPKSRTQEEYKNWHRRRSWEHKKVIGKILQYWQQGKQPTSQQRKEETPKVRAVLHNWRKLKMGQDGILRRKSRSNLELLLPQRFIYQQLHKEMGHLGTERVVDLAWDRFYWLHIQRDIEHYITNVHSCLKQRQPNLKTQTPMKASGPLSHLSWYWSTLCI